MVFTLCAVLCINLDDRNELVECCTSVCDSIVVKAIGFLLNYLCTTLFIYFF